MTGIVLNRADQADLGFIMSTERRPGYEEVVGRWDEDRHRSALQDGRHAYFIGSSAGERIGFVIVRDWQAVERASLIKRIAVVEPSQGLGRKLLRAVVDSVFRETDAYRLWLGVFPENARAQAAYSSVGFQPEGIARGSAFFGGLYRDELIMSLLRPEWEA